MTAESILDNAAQIIANARVESTKIGARPKDIAKIMLDEAVLALVASGLKIADIEKVLKTYTKYDIPVFVAGIRQSALKGAAGIKVH